MQPHSIHANKKKLARIYLAVHGSHDRSHRQLRHVRGREHRVEEQNDRPGLTCGARVAPDRSR